MPDPTPYGLDDDEPPCECPRPECREARRQAALAAIAAHRARQAHEPSTR